MCVFTSCVRKEGSVKSSAVSEGFAPPELVLSLPAAAAVTALQVGNGVQVLRQQRIHQGLLVHGLLQCVCVHYGASICIESGDFFYIFHWRFRRAAHTPGEPEGASLGWHPELNI